MIIKKIFIIGAFTSVSNNGLNKYKIYYEILKKQFPNAEIKTPNDILIYRLNFERVNKNATVKQIADAMVKYDIEQVTSSDLIVADVSIASTGLGIELGSLMGKRKKILLFALKDFTISNMVIGAFDNVNLVRYNRLEELDMLLNESLKKLF